VLGLLGWLWATSTFSKVERVEVASVLDAADGGGTNYLIVGSDSRGGAEENGGVDGQRSDTLLVLRTDGDQSRIMSIPRDLVVTNAATGEDGRINGAYNQGPANVIETIRNNLDIPIQRYVEVDFVTFASMVDALGGVTIDFPNTAIDRESGLVVSETGPVILDGEEALAYVRSRNYTEIIDGQEVVDPSGDLGRVNRQQVFLRTVLAKAGASRNPLTLMRVASSVTGGLRIDDAMTLTDAVRFAWNMGRLNPESVVLPVTARTTGGAAVLDLVEAEAPAALDQFR
jgi:LCP family protein required for cell wall assembly